MTNERKPDSPCIAHKDECAGVFIPDGSEQSCERCNHVAAMFEPLEADQ